MADKVVHATVKPAKTAVHAQHPFRSDKNHEKLLNYLQQRLMVGKEQRDHKLERFAQIDRNVSGWQKLSEEDKKRKAAQEKNGNPQAIQMNLPLSFVHLDDMMTYFAATFSPNRGMFYHNGKPDEASEANQIVTLMNNHAIYAGYYRETLQAIWSTLKYNIGGFYCYWARDEGPKLTKNAQNQDVLSVDVKWQGNKLEALDNYNTFYDPTVHPTKLSQEGEWCARAKMISHYQLRHKANRGVYFNVDEALANDTGVTECVYYRNPPAEAMLDIDESKAGTDYMEWFGAAPDYAMNSGFELVEVFIRINPLDFGLLAGSAAENANRNGYEVWRFTILNDKTIIDATYMNNIHGLLPFFFGVINDDLMGQSQKAVSEILQPLQDFASFLLNIHVQASRKNVWGTTFYDPTVVDMGAIPKGEVSARVPIKASGYGKDLRQSIVHDSNNLDTKQTLQDLQGVIGIIDQFFPTQSMPSQIASIDRAVDSQVAAVQQGANRRMHKTARLLDDTLFRGMRFCCYYNIVQYQPDNVSVEDFYGRKVVIDLNKLRETDLPFIIGQGLKAIDRQAAAGALQQIIFALVQNPQAAQRIDMIGLIDYWTNMIDIDVDMTKFHLAPEQPAQAGPNAGLNEGQMAASNAGAAPAEVAAAPEQVAA